MVGKIYPECQRSSLIRGTLRGATKRDRPQVPQKEGGLGVRWKGGMAAHPWPGRAPGPVTALSTHSQQLRAPSKTCACGGAYFNFNLSPTSTPPPSPPLLPHPHRRNATGPAAIYCFPLYASVPLGKLSRPLVIVLLCFLVPCSNLRFSHRHFPVSFKQLSYLSIAGTSKGNRTPRELQWKKHDV